MKFSQSHVYNPNNFRMKTSLNPNLEAILRIQKQLPKEQTVELQEERILLNSRYKVFLTFPAYGTVDRYLGFLNSKSHRDGSIDFFLHLHDLTASGPILAGASLESAIEFTLQRIGEQILGLSLAHKYGKKHEYVIAEFNRNTSYDFNK